MRDPVHGGFGRCSPDQAVPAASVGSVTADTLSSESAARLRAELVATLRQRGSIRTPAVAAAFAKVPREKFAPEASLSAAYAAHDVVVTKRNADGDAVSSVSAPWLQAEMLEVARLERGDRVLEIGSGGYNAALIAEIVGPAGTVVTVDIDRFVTERAARFLAETGYRQVRVVLGDGEYAAEPYGPYDAIIVTAGAWDCPWGHLLAPGGRLIVPLRFASITRSITFVRDGDRLVGQDPTVCGFVPIQGAGSHTEQVAVLADGAVKLTIDGGPVLDTAALDRAITETRAELWTTATIGNGESFDTLHLWLATVTDTFGWIWPNPKHDGDLIRPAVGWFCPTLITPDSFAYLTIRAVHSTNETDQRRHQLGVHGHGHRGTELAQQLAEHVTTWDRHRRNSPGPNFTLHPAEAPVPVPAVGRVFPKRHTQLLMAWPDQGR
jgi:protein-L-isoaspartate(D-aspartate) O-methyltransferase